MVFCVSAWRVLQITYILIFLTRTIEFGSWKGLTDNQRIMTSRKTTSQDTWVWTSGPSLKIVLLTFIEGFPCGRRCLFFPNPPFCSPGSQHSPPAGRERLWLQNPRPLGHSTASPCGLAQVILTSLGLSFLLCRIGGKKNCLIQLLWGLDELL